MKHTILPVLLIVLSLLAGCARGDVNKAEFIVGASVRYTQAEIRDAMDVAADHFRNHFDGCALLTMEYCEERTGAAAAEWATTYGAEEGIVLLSSFEVDEKGGDGSLNPGDTYNNWQWILTRSGDEAWQLQTWGYG